MKRIFSTLIALVLMLSTISSIPFNNLFANAMEWEINNTYDDDGIYYVKNTATGNKIKRFTNASASYSDVSLDNGKGAESLFAYGASIDPDSQNPADKYLLFYGFARTSSTDKYGVKIYDNNDSNKALFIPKKGETYKISFKYKTSASQWLALSLRLKGLSDTSKGFDGKTLSNLVTIEKNDKTNDNKWVECSTEVLIDDDYYALSISPECDDTKDAFVWKKVSIDNIKITKVSLNTGKEIENNFSESNIYYKTGTDKYLTRYSDAACTQNIDSSFSFAKYAKGEIAKGEGENGTDAFKFKEASAHNNIIPAALRIYDNTDPNYKVYKPEKNTSYKIKVKYKTDKQFAYSNVLLKVCGMKSKSGAFEGKELATLATIPTSKTNIKDQWLEAELIFKTGDEDYESLGLFLATTALGGYYEQTDAIVELNFHINYINLSEIAGEKKILCHNYTNGTEDKEISIDQGALIDDIEIPTVAGKVFDNWYLDSALTQKAGKNVADVTELWAKWRNVSDGIFNTFDDRRVFYNTDNSYLTRYSNLECTELKDSALSFNRFAKGKIVENAGEDGSSVFRFTEASAHKNITPAALRIYDSTSKDLSIFKPEKNTSYHIKVKYKTDKQFGYSNVILKVCGMKANDTAFEGKEFATLVSVPTSRDKDVKNQWLEAEINFKTDNEDYESLGLFLATNATTGYYETPEGKVELSFDIDDISILNVSGTKDIVCHNYANGTADKVLTVEKAGMLDDLDIPFSNGKIFDEWYLDSSLTQKPGKYLYNIDELWVKWRTTADRIVNTYDDSSVYFKDEASDYVYRYSDKDFTNLLDGTANNKFPFAQGKIDNSAGVDGSKAYRTAYASSEAQTTPAAVVIYDNTDKDKKLYQPRRNTVYKIKFQYKQTTSKNIKIFLMIKAFNNTNGKFNVGTPLACAVEFEPNVAIVDWKTAELYFSTPNTQYDSIGIFPMITDNASVKSLDFIIDNVELTEIADTYHLFLDTVGGSKESPVSFVPGYELLNNMPVPTKEGYIFAGWYKDSAYTQEFKTGIMPSNDINLYAKWEALATTPESLKIGFESSDFQYVNTGMDGNHISGNFMTDTASVVTDPSDSYEGNSYMHLKNYAKTKTLPQKLSAVALVKPNGEYYQVQAGQRYKINYTMRADTYANIMFVTADQIPSGNLSCANSDILVDSFYHFLWYGSGENTWSSIEEYIAPEKSGKLYVLVYYTAEYIDLDGISIVPVSNSEATYVKHYKEDGKTLLKTSLGGFGKQLVAPQPPAKEGYVFDGWVDENGNKFSKAQFPNKDTVLRATYKQRVTVDNPSTLQDPTVFTFDENPQEAAAFYGSGENAYIDETSIFARANNHAGIFYQTEDSANAHSGDSYFRYANAGDWTSEKYKRFRIFDPNSADHMVYLEPYSVYKVKFWLKLERTWSTGLRLVAFDTTNKLNILSQEIVLDLNEIEYTDTYGKWVEYEATLATGEELSTLGFSISGGYLTASFDDISVSKLGWSTVTFESNGGTQIESKKVLAGRYIAAPANPTKAGYTFAGWYSDSALTNKFNFNKTPIQSDMVFYAAWLPVVEEKPQYKKVVTYEKETKTVDNEIEDKELDEKVNFVNKDKVGKISKIESSVKDANSPNNVVRNIIIIISSVILLSAIVTVSIIFIKKRKLVSGKRR